MVLLVGSKRFPNEEKTIQEIYFEFFIPRNLLMVIALRVETQKSENPRNEMGVSRGEKGGGMRVSFCAWFWS